DILCFSQGCQARLTQVANNHPRRKLATDEAGCRLREQDLTSIAKCHDARDAVQSWPGVIIDGVRCRAAAVQTHAYADRRLAPVCPMQGPLGRECRSERVTGDGKRRTERVTGDIEDVAMMRLDRLAQ